MFFRRSTPKTPTFQERVDTLKSAGFSVTPLPGGTLRIGKGDCAVDIRENNGAIAWLGRAGVLFCGEVASLVDGGYQKFFRTPSGVKKPAMADELVALHNFEEDLRQATGEKSLYNESLGTVSTFYQYDRVTDRDRGVPKRAWE
jgi:hypothetical protein